ncbi:GCS-domain-containing protein, partial [Ramicandelaber brevisporus]
MGLLTHGNSLPWDIIKLHAETLRSRATSQLIKIYNVNKDRSGDTHLFGDEIEYSIIRFDHGKREAKAALLSHEALDLLNGKFKSEEADWQTEVGRFMVEGIPGTPYGASTDDLLDVEKNMKARRKQANTVVAAINTAGGDGDASSLSSTKVVSITTYPRLGCGSDTLYPAGLVVNGPILHSPTLPDKVVTGHERYRHAGYNFAARRNGPLRAFMPVFKDKSTPSPFVYNHPDCAGIEIPDDHIYLDNAVYGPTCSCLQVTMQANNLNQARRLYDQLTVLAPLLMAVSAAAPIFHGHLLDSDCRWGVLEACLDDRSQYECGL